LKNVLCIGGFDPSGAAGILADSATLIELGVIPLTAITALTSQNSQGVFDILIPEPQHLRTQLEVILSDYSVRAIKIGMLGNSDNVKVVSNLLKIHRVTVVLDPVFYSTSNTALLDTEGISVLINQLLAQCSIVTPNISEAEKLAGIKINNDADIEKAARIIQDMGPDWVIIKGGHLPGRPVDFIFNGNDLLKLEQDRIDKQMRGTGCIFASALAANLSLGLSMPQSALAAKKYVTKKIQKAVKLGSGAPQAVWESK